MKDREPALQWSDVGHFHANERHYNGHELGTFKKKERQVSMSTVANEERWVGEVDNEMGLYSAVITQWILTATLPGRLFSTPFCR